MKKTKPDGLSHPKLKVAFDDRVFGKMQELDELYDCLPGKIKGLLDLYHTDGFVTAQMLSMVRRYAPEVSSLTQESPEWQKLKRRAGIKGKGCEWSGHNSTVLEKAHIGKKSAMKAGRHSRYMNHPVNVMMLCPNHHSMMDANKMEARERARFRSLCRRRRRLIKLVMCQVQAELAQLRRIETAFCQCADVIRDKVQGEIYILARNLTKGRLPKPKRHISEWAVLAEAKKAPTHTALRAAKPSTSAGQAGLLFPG